MDGTMISVRALSMRLASGGREVHVLTDVSLDVPAGQFLAIAGPSGSGKSTLLGLIAGLDQPTAGRIEVAGVDITALDEDGLARFRRDHVGTSSILPPAPTSPRRRTWRCRSSGRGRRSGRARGRAARRGGPGRARAHYRCSSGGEQQRVSGGRAMARRPALILADEPTGNLDSATGKQSIELLVGLNRRLGSTLVLVTHDAALAAHADRVVTLRDGRIVSDE